MYSQTYSLSLSLSHTHTHTHTHTHKHIETHTPACAHKGMRWHTVSEAHMFASVACRSGHARGDPPYMLIRVVGIRGSVCGGRRAERAWVVHIRKTQRPNQLCATRLQMSRVESQLHQHLINRHRAFTAVKSHIGVPTRSVSLYQSNRCKGNPACRDVTVGHKHYTQTQQYLTNSTLKQHASIMRPSYSSTYYASLPETLGSPCPSEIHTRLCFLPQLVHCR